MRESCLDCARKHLAQADILMMECATGDYPTHKWYAVGHMAEAADELLMGYKSIADRIRDERLKYMDDSTYNIDIGAIISLITEIADQEVLTTSQSESEALNES